MNYQKIYDALIIRGKNRKLDCYTEKHHIIPRCVGGNDDDNNLVDLTPEEHYVAHQLLVKIYKGNYSLVKAATMMIPRRPTNKMYGWVRRQLSDIMSKSQSGTGNSQFGTKWIHNKELKLSKKVPKNEIASNGWEEGRIIKFDKIVHDSCPVCGNNKDTKRKFCSLSCSASYHNRNKQTKFDAVLEKMIEDYVSGKSISSCLNDNGMCGTGSNFVKLKTEIINRGLV